MLHQNYPVYVVISNYLKSLDTSKASIMGISTKLLIIIYKECANEIVPTLCMLFNSCIERGVNGKILIW